MDILDLELYRIEVDNRYFEDIAIPSSEDVSVAIDTAIDLAEESLGKSVRGFYLNTETNTINLYMHLWSNNG